jgi:hypothetical protein
VTATLQLLREPIGMELRRGRFNVLLDGNDIGWIETHQTLEVPIEPGRHRLEVKAGRYRSKQLPFDVADGEIAKFRCSGSRVWPVYVASIVKPDLALTLKSE